MASSCNLKVIGVLYNPRLKRDNLVMKWKKKYLKTGMTCRPFSIRNVDRANENPKTNRLKNHWENYYVFYFECRQENGNHEPNLCIIQNEADKERIFQGDNTRDEFCEWLFRTQHANCTVMGSGVANSIIGGAHIHIFMFCTVNFV